MKFHYCQSHLRSRSRAGRFTNQQAETGELARPAERIPNDFLQVEPEFLGSLVSIARDADPQTFFAISMGKGVVMSGERTPNLDVLENQSGAKLTIGAGPRGNRYRAESMLLDISMELRFVGSCQSKQGSGHVVPHWLADLREMRGRIIYDQGRRLFFRLSDGKFDDSDSADLEAYHIIVSLEGRAVGCARILPLSNGQPCAVSSILGEGRLEKILAQIGTTRARSCEASRWLVVPECRKGLGPKIVAASWAVGRWLGAEIALILAGTRQKQDRALTRLGAHAIDGLPLFRSEIFDDELRLLYFDVAMPSELMEKQITEMAKVLKLDSLQAPIRPTEAQISDGDPSLALRLGSVALRRYNESDAGARCQYR